MPCHELLSGAAGGRAGITDMAGRGHAGQGGPGLQDRDQGVQEGRERGTPRRHGVPGGGRRQDSLFRQGSAPAPGGGLYTGKAPDQVCGAHKAFCRQCDPGDGACCT